jgi:Uma2 family endonuclease
METLTQKTYTYEDYARLPEGVPYQLIGGELIRSPAPTPYQQRLLANLLFEMTSFVREHNLGLVIPAPIDVFLSEEDTPQPDLISSPETASTSSAKKRLKRHRIW